MSEDLGKQPGQPRRRQLALLAVLLLVVVIGAAAFFGVPRLVGQATATPSPTRAPTLTLPPTASPTLTPIPSPTALPAPTSTPAVLTPTISGVSAQVNDQAGTITFHVEADVPPSQKVAEAILWYDTEAGRQLRQFAGPLPGHISLSYELDVAQEGLTRTVTTTAELDYWWLVTDTSGASVRAGGTALLGPALLAKVRAAAPAPLNFTWLVSDTQHIQFYYAPDSAAERDRFQLGRVADAAFEHDEAVLHLSFNGQIKVYLVPRVFWQGGATYGDKVVLISYLDRNYTGVEMWSYFTHEETHALAQDLVQSKPNGGGPDGVLVEGLAVWASGGHYAAEPIDAWAAVTAASSAYIPLAQLRAGPFYNYQHEISYIEAASFDGFLIRTYGLDKFKELYGQATGKDDQDETLVTKLYGKRYEALEADWLAYLKTLSPTPEQTESWHLEVRAFDLIRRYEAVDDPNARILPDKSPPEWTSDTLKIFLNHPSAATNVVLETALVAAESRIQTVVSATLTGTLPVGLAQGGAPQSDSAEENLAQARAILNDVEASLAAGGSILRPSLEARQAIFELVAEQDRAVLVADEPAYLRTFERGAAPANPESLLRQPFTQYQQELAALDISADGRSATGVVVVHGRLANEGFADEGGLYAVTFVRHEGLWLMTRRVRTETTLQLPPPPPAGSGVPARLRGAV